MKNFLNKIAVVEFRFKFLTTMFINAYWDYELFLKLLISFNFSLHLEDKLRKKKRHIDNS